MPSPKTSPGGFSFFSIFTAGLLCLMPLASASTPLQRDEPFYGPSSDRLYPSTSVAASYQAPSESAHLYSSYAVQPTGYSHASSSAALYSSATKTGLVPYPHNATVPYSTGGVTVTPTPHKATSILLTTVMASSSAASGPPAEVTPNSAANMAASFAGLVFAGGVAILAL